MSISQQFIQESVTRAIGLIATVKVFLDQTGTLDCIVKIEEDVKRTSQKHASDGSKT